MSKQRIALLIFWLMVLSLPFIYGFFNKSDELFFGGFLLNPIDGHSYLAKIQQGYSGEWYFQLPYTAQENSKIILFVFYNLIGHFSKLIGLSAIFSFHLFRLIFSIVLFFSIHNFLNIFEIKERNIKSALFIILFFGGGFGWLYFITGDLPADFWVAEAFPFLSSFSNPHFPLSIALMLYVFILGYIKISEKLKNIYLFLIGFVLANISPFAVIISGFLLLIKLILEWNSDRKMSFNNLIGFAFGSSPIAIYQYLTIRNDAVLSGWNAQNQTPAPNLANILFSFSPFIIGIVLFLIFRIIRHNSKFSKMEIHLICWIFVVFILIYLPFDLQRRFLIGFYLPVTVLFFLFFQGWFQDQKKYNWKEKIFLPGIVILVLMSNMVIISGAYISINSKSEKIYLPQYINSASTWMRENCEPNSIVLSGPETGLLIPSYTYSRTVFGHPFETIDYAQTKTRLLSFWQSNNLDDEIDTLREWKVDYIFYGQEERELGSPKVLDLLNIIYEDSSVKVFEVDIYE